MVWFQWSQIFVSGSGSARSGSEEKADLESESSLFHTGHWTHDIMIQSIQKIQVIQKIRVIQKIQVIQEKQVRQVKQVKPAQL